MASFFRYPGGKSKFKKEIMAAIQQYCDGCDEYREPFFGGGSVGLMVLDDNDHRTVDPLFIGLPAVTKKKKKDAPKTFNFRTFWVNDKDVGVYSLWRSVTDFPEMLKEKVRAFTPTINDFDQFKDFLVTDPVPTTDEEIVDIGFKKLAIHQISYSGLGVKSGGPLGGRKQKSAYKIDCRWSPEYICKKIDSVHEQFADVQMHVTSGDFSVMFADDGKKSLIYLDPPYYIKGGELYHKSFTEEDHARLADGLRNTKHQWVLSYDDCPEIRDLYSSWARIEVIDANYTINTSTTKTELIIYPY